MPATFAGVPLAQPTPELLEWVGPNLLSFREAHLRPTLTDWNRPVTLNTLWWPTGASRWAEAWFVVDGPALDQIKQQVYQSESTPQERDLVITDGTSSVTAPMWMLPPIPLTSYPLTYDAGQLKLWLVVLVDDRYRWREVTTATLDVAEGTPWEDVVAAIAAELNLEFAQDPVDPAYLAAPAGLGQALETLPSLLDRVLFCVGQRLVRNLDGTVEVLGVGESEDRLAQDLADLDQVTAGGLLDLDVGSATSDVPGLLPATVRVLFRQATATVGDDAWSVHEVDVATLDPERFGGRTGGDVMDLVSMTLAVFSAEGWANEADCIALAERFASDWCRYRLAGHDVEMGQVFDWGLEGLSDSVEWGCQTEDHSTWARRPPYDDYHLYAGVPKGAPAATGAGAVLARITSLTQNTAGWVPGVLWDSNHGDGAAIWINPCEFDPYPGYPLQSPDKHFLVSPTGNVYSDGVPCWDLVLDEDARYTQPGIVNLSEQYLGAGRKWLDSAGFPVTPGVMTEGVVWRLERYYAAAIPPPTAQSEVDVRHLTPGYVSGTSHPSTDVFHMAGITTNQVWLGQAGTAANRGELSGRTFTYGSAGVGTMFSARYSSTFRYDSVPIGQAVHYSGTGTPPTQEVMLQINKDCWLASNGWVLAGKGYIVYDATPTWRVGKTGVGGAGDTFVGGICVGLGSAGGISGIFGG